MQLADNLNLTYRLEGGNGGETVGEKRKRKRSHFFDVIRLSSEDDPRHKPEIESHGYLKIHCLYSTNRGPKAQHIKSLKATSNFNVYDESTL